MITYTKVPNCPWIKSTNTPIPIEIHQRHNSGGCFIIAGKAFTKDYQYLDGFTSLLQALLFCEATFRVNPHSPFTPNTVSYKDYK